MCASFVSLAVVNTIGMPGSTALLGSAPVSVKQDFMWLLDSVHCQQKG